MFSAADYVDWFVRHLPKGPVWPIDRETTPVWFSLLDAMSAEPARMDAFLFGIPAAYIPSPNMAPDMLDDWETLLALTPQASDSDTDRITAILALLGQYLSPSVFELQARADLFGVDAVVTHHEYPLPFAGQAVAGDPVRDVQWVYAWTITYTGPANPVFEAAMRAVSPAHTTLLFELI